LKTNQEKIQPLISIDQITQTHMIKLMFFQCACLYAPAGLVAHLWWVRCEIKKKLKLNGIRNLPSKYIHPAVWIVLVD
jgi:hypothetical protein